MLQRTKGPSSLAKAFLDDQDPMWTFATLAQSCQSGLRLVRRRQSEPSTDAVRHSYSLGHTCPLRPRALVLCKSAITPWLLLLRELPFSGPRLCDKLFQLTRLFERLQREGRLSLLVVIPGPTLPALPVFGHPGPPTCYTALRGYFQPSGQASCHIESAESCRRSRPAALGECKPKLRV